jgi:hypothetical protein
MTGRLRILPLLAAVLLAGACKLRPGDGASLRGKAPEAGTSALREDAARAQYQPPVDGRLTEQQVERYLEVRERALKIREELREDLATADLRATRELGYNPKELQWIEERVLEARVSHLGEQLDRRIDASRRQFVAGLQEERKMADPARRAEIDRLISQFGPRSPSLPEPRRGGPAGPAVLHNTELLARYEERLERLEAALQRPSSL